VRVVAFNVKRCVAGVPEVAAVLRSLNPDVVALNEVVRGQVRALAHDLGMHPVAGPVIWFIGYGNALLLRERPAWSRNVLLRAVRGFERRGVVIAGAGGITVAATHLSTHARERADQARELADLMRAWPTAVIAGDLNEQPGGPVAAALARFRDAFAECGDGDGSTFHADKPERRIDYVLVTPDVRVTACRVCETVASDHLALVADLAPPGA
jgi:endonuclease/exonuclease/phosphatase family metal-dependent hydrolase